MADLGGSEGGRPPSQADEVRAVAADEWIAAAESARDEGFVWFDSLHVIDEILRPIEDEEELRVVLRLARLQDLGTGLQIHTRVPRDNPQLTSLKDLWAGAEWHEREAHDFFGLLCEGADQRPLLWRPTLPDAPDHPMLKHVILGDRVEKPWPGAIDPEQEGGAQASRRRMAPPGVPDLDLSSAPEPAEVVAALSAKGRMRRRGGER